MQIRVPFGSVSAAVHLVMGSPDKESHLGILVKANKISMETILEASKDTPPPYSPLRSRFSYFAVIALLTKKSLNFQASSILGNDNAFPTITFNLVEQQMLKFLEVSV